MKMKDIKDIEHTFSIEKRGPHERDLISFIIIKMLNLFINASYLFG